MATAWAPNTRRRKLEFHSADASDRLRYKSIDWLTMSQLLLLPPDLLEGILTQLEVKDLLRFACVCKYTDAICQQDALWLRKHLRSHPKRVSYKVASVPEADNKESSS